MRKLFGLVVLSLSAAVCAPAQQLDFNQAATADPAALAKAMPALAGAVIAAYHDDDRVKYLDNLFRLQLVAGRYADALRTLATLHELITDPKSPATAAYNVQDQIFARAKVIEGGEGVPFDQAFQRAFRERFSTLDNRTSALVIRTYTFPERVLRADFDSAAATQKGKNLSLSLTRSRSSAPTRWTKSSARLRRLFNRSLPKTTAAATLPKGASR